MQQWNSLSNRSETSPTQDKDKEKPFATLRDLQKGTFYHCTEGKNILASTRTNFLIDFPLEEDCNLIIIRSKTDSSSYTAELIVTTGKSQIKLIRGKAFIDSLPLSRKQQTPLTSGQILALGDLKNQLQFIERDQIIRKLPRGPLWGALDTMDIAYLRPKSASPNPPFGGRLTSSVSDCSLFTSSSSYQMNNSLQQILKRVSRDVQLRKTGQKDSKQPLPPTYEQVGNSIGYQLFLQSHPNVTEKLINSMYPLLKELHSSSEWLFTDFLDAFNDSLKKKATPQCLHPSDLPTIKFLADLCVHVSALPPDTQHRCLKPDPSLWMKLLAIFSSSAQNQQVLVDYRCPSKVVGCMNLTSMAENKDLQTYSWEVLTNVLTVSTPTDKKPPIHLQALTLLLSLMKQQLDQDLHRLDLIIAILKFLQSLSTIVRTCATTTVVNPDNPQPYSQSYAREVFKLLEENNVHDVILDLPNFIQKSEEVSSAIEVILISMAPLPIPARKIPPPKPKRSRCRTQFISTPSLIQVQDEKTKLHPPHHRKLPEVPSKRTSKSPPPLPPSKPEYKPSTVRSKSSHDILDDFAISIDRSLPVGLTSLQRSAKSNKNTRPLIPLMPPSRMEASLPITTSSSTVMQQTNESMLLHVDHSLPANGLSNYSTVQQATSENSIGNITNDDSSIVDVADDVEKPAEIRRFRSETFTKEVHTIDPTQKDSKIIENSTIPSVPVTNGLTTSEHMTDINSSAVSTTTDDDNRNIEEEKEEFSKTGSLSRLNPASLTHYNRLSLKKRGSYTKAVTSSQIKQSKEETMENSKVNKEIIEEKHKSIVTTLFERKELLENINDLWKSEKSLQAASNCVLSCFFSGCADIPLFIDCLTCFQFNTKCWTVGVCVVLLPYMRQVLTTQEHIRYLKTVFDTLSLIIHKFSTLILSIKNKKATRADMEQKQACYHELHLVATTLSKMETADIVLLAMLNKFRQILMPFSDPL